jgi:AraC-like DNA-binding protein
MIHDPRSEPVPLEYVRSIADYMRSSGTSVEQWLAASELPAVELVRPQRTIPFSAFRRLVGAAMAATREPALGLFVGQRTGATSHGMVGAAAVHSGSVRQALDTVARYAGTRTGLLTIRHATEGDRQRVSFSGLVPLGDMERPVLELAVLSVKNILDEITLGTVGVIDVAFHFADPGYSALANEFFGCPVEYSQAWTGFEVPVSALDRRLHRPDPQAYEEAADVCRRELRSIAENTSWAARLRRIFLEHQDHSGFPSLHIAARQLHLTPRTLHRRLEEEETSFREELDSVRHMLALSYLRSPRLGVREVAYRLGYTDTSNFRRAFKRWQGQTPRETRSETGCNEREEPAERGAAGVPGDGSSVCG